ncbi:MAG: 2-oxoglutarate oxidoreductase, partial [Desulfonatronovibrionaceae bacterium]
MEEVLAYKSPSLLADRPSHYCPGCHHGTIHKLVARCLENMGLGQDTICIGSIGCSVFIYNYILVDAVEAPYGR